MNPKIKQIYTRPRNFVRRHKVGLAVTATALACFALNQAALKQHNEFLAEKGLLDEFYSPEESE